MNLKDSIRMDLNKFEWINFCVFFRNVG